MEDTQRLIVRQVALKAAVELIIADKGKIEDLEKFTDRIQQIILK